MIFLLSLGYLAKVIGKDEEILEFYPAVQIQIEKRIRASKSIGKHEKVIKAHPAIAIEIGKNSSGLIVGQSHQGDFYRASYSLHIKSSGQKTCGTIAEYALVIDDRIIVAVKSVLSPHSTPLQEQRVGGTCGIAENVFYLTGGAIPDIDANGNELLFPEILPDLFNTRGPRETVRSIETKEIDKDHPAPELAQGRLASTQLLQGKIWSDITYLRDLTLQCYAPH